MLEKMWSCSKESNNAPLRKSELIQVEGTRKKIKIKNNDNKKNKNNMSIKEITKSMTSDRIEW